MSTQVKVFGNQPMKLKESTAKELKIAVVVSRFNELITEKLLQGAVQHLERNHVHEVHVYWVPGAFEIPLMSDKICQKKYYDGVVALGAVIRGATSHYDYVCSATVSGIKDVNLKHGVPVSFGVLTVDTLEQAFDRVGGKLGNKGAEAAEATLAMIYGIQGILN